jgi:hypothetical protein
MGNLRHSPGHSARIAWLALLLLAAFLVAVTVACGDDDDEDSGDGDNGTGAAETSSTGDGETADGEDDGDAGDEDGDGTTGALECPSESEMSDAVGAEMFADPSTGTCAFKQADDSDGEVVLLTFSNADLTLRDETVEEVEGLGERAIWEGNSLTVWTGEGSVIVTMLGDAMFSEDGQELAIAVARVVIE